MHPQQDKIKSRLDAMLADLIKRQSVKQALIAVESGDRSFQWTGAIGETVTGERIIADTPFFVASIDKLYNATTTMLLNETGQIDISKPISAYLPEAMTRQLHTARGQDLSDQILVRHLLIGWKITRQAVAVSLKVLLRMATGYLCSKNRSIMCVITSSHIFRPKICPQGAPRCVTPTRTLF